MQIPESPIRSPKRNLCSTCERPVQTCYCDLIRQTPTHSDIVLLQHPTEVQHSKNTGHFLTRCLISSHRLIGESFNCDENPLSSMLNDNCFNVLLYPSTAEAQSLGMIESTAVDVAHIKKLLSENKKIRLWCIDATWKKSRKILYLNPWLQQLPRLQLDSMPDSLYRIRKAEKQYQLSSFEACCYALASWETDFTLNALLSAFQQFIDRTGQFRPHDG